MKALAFPGEALRERREELGLSLQEVHEQIHVPMLHIAALERGDIAALPAPAYTTGFITSYCECLGIPPYRFIDRYHLMLDAMEVAARSRAQAPAPSYSRGFALPVLPVLPARRPAWVAEALTWGAVCGVLLLAWITYTVVLKPAPAEDNRIEAGTIEIEMPEYHFLEEHQP